MSQQPGDLKTDDQVATVIMVLIVVVAIYFERKEIMIAWMESTYSRMEWLASIPVVGGLFTGMVADYKAHPVFTNTIKYDYVIGWLFDLAIVPALIWGGFKAHAKRKAWSNRTMTPALYQAVIGKKTRKKFRQAMTEDEWIAHFKLDALYETGTWQGVFMRAIRLQVTAGGPCTPDHPVLLEFAEYLRLPKEVVPKCAKEHAYLSTAMVRLLAYARAKKGVVQEHGFSERLQADRNLAPIYFALQSTGGNCCFFESIGIMEHYQAEISIHQPIKDVQIEFAVDVMEKCLARRKHQRDEEQAIKDRL